MNMRSRSNTTIHRKNASAAVQPSSANGGSTSHQKSPGSSMSSDSFFDEVDDDNCNGKGKIGGPKHQQNNAGESSSSLNESSSFVPPLNSSSAPRTPPRSGFGRSMPPPPKMTSLTLNDKHAPLNHNRISMSAKLDSSLVDNDKINSPASQSPQPPVSMPIPPPPSTFISTKNVYQRGKAAVNVKNDAKKEAATVPIPEEPVTSTTASDNATTTNISTYSSYNSYNNPAYNVVPPPQAISHPYKPSTWYADARQLQKRRKRIKKILGLAGAIIFGLFSWRTLKHLKIYLQEEIEKHSNNHHHHHHEYHRHHPGHLHAMTGLVESPMGFYREKSDPVKEEVNALPTEAIEGKAEEKRPTIKLEPPPEQSAPNIEEDNSKSVGIQHAQEIFYSFPVATLSNNRLLPYIGFGVASRSVEHKQIPTIVATLLQYASAETEGGGGIAMIDAVIDEEKDAGYNDEFETNMAKTVITLVGRAINYFGKENARRRAEEASAGSGSIEANVRLRSGKKDVDGVETSKSFDDKFSEGYDYDHRLEVHLLIGISSSDIGSENTIQALRNIVVELDGLVPSIPPGDLANTDVSEWKVEMPPVPLVDRHVDVRLQLLLHAPHCSKGPTTVPCSPGDSGHKMTLDKWVDSWKMLKKLYDAKIIHGFGLDGATAGDLQYLFSQCDIAPLLYRGDISKAVDGYGRRMGNRMPGDEDGIASILKEKGVTYLASNVAGHILERKKTAPNAYALLQMLGKVLFHAHHQMSDRSLVTAAHKGAGEYYTVPRLVLSYLIRHGVCALPHAYKPEHLADDAPESVGGLASLLTERRVAEIGVALEALLSGHDLPEDFGSLGAEGEDSSAVVFHNESGEEVYLVQVLNDPDSGYGDKEVPISPEHGGSVLAGGSVVIIANSGDKFAAYGLEDGKRLGSYTVQSAAGGADDFTIT